MTFSIYVTLKIELNQDPFAMAQKSFIKLF